MADDFAEQFVATYGKNLPPGYEFHIDYEKKVISVRETLKLTHFTVDEATKKVIRDGGWGCVYEQGDNGPIYLGSIYADED